MNPYPAIARTPYRGRASARKRSRHGHTLVEILVSSAITLLILAGVIALLRSTADSIERQHTKAVAGNRARTSLDEVALVMRYADAVLPSKEIDGVTYVTGENTVVLSAPGYDPKTPGLVLPGVTDYIVLSFDAQKGELRETCVPGTGSVRPYRSLYRLSEGVKSVQFSYLVREVLTWNATETYALKTAPITPPATSVNGKSTQNTWSKVLPKAVAAKASANSDIQLVYGIDPTANPGTALPLVKEVVATVVFDATNRNNVTQTHSMTATARLRNQRK